MARGRKSYTQQSKGTSPDLYNGMVVTCMLTVRNRVLSCHLPPIHNSLIITVERICDGAVH